MRIVVVSQYYLPEDAHLVAELAESLAERGHSIVVVTAYPNYPAGRLYDGYRQAWRRVESHDGVTVRRVPIVISHSRNPLGRIVNYVSYGVSTLLASGVAKRADVVYVYATQMTAAIAPSIWRLLGGAPFVLHVQDLWPESITASGMVGGRVGEAMERVLGTWLRWTYRRAAATVAIAPTMLAKLIDRGVPENRGHLVYNWGRRIEGDGDVTAAERPGLTVMFAGTLGDFQDLDTAIEAARLVTDLEDFRLTLVGTGSAETRLKKLAQGLESVEFRGRVPSDEMHGVYRESDFQLVSLKDVDIFHGTIPSKFQASVSLGLPVITTVAGDLSALVDANDLGFVARPEDAEALARAFRAAYALSSEQRREMGDRASAFYEDAMTRETAIGQIETILTDAAERKTRK
jgi:glycosyltransferase involved in cell wall biosynthesis